MPERELTLAERLDLARARLRELGATITVVDDDIGAERLAALVDIEEDRVRRLERARAVELAAARAGGLDVTGLE